MPPVNALRLVAVGTCVLDVGIFVRWNVHVAMADAKNDKKGQGLWPQAERSAQARIAVANHRKYMEDNWTVSLRNLREGRWWTLVTSAFSHSEPTHLAVNVYMLWQAYRILHYLGVGALRASALGLGSAIAGNAAFLWDRSTRSEPRERERPGYGSSAVVTGLLAGAMMAVPKLPMGIPFLPLSFSLRTAVLAWSAFDVFGLVAERTKGYQLQSANVAYAAHLGGSAFGVVFYALALRKFRVFIP